ncbi:MAG: bifunctional precorrin-2 dehydrogenase/sirohydrochlorin ferrochelatase, partial [Nitrospirae bacterium]
IKGRRCVVIGGGKVAERKVLSLLGSEAEVTVISPKLTECLEALKRLGRISHIPRAYQKGDLEGAFIAIVATDEEDVNIQASEEAHALGVPVNVVDRPELCSFIVPSVLRRGPLVVAISTSGTSPAMARNLRRFIEDELPEGIEEVLLYLSELRQKVQSLIPEPTKRKTILERVASEDVIKILKEEGPSRARDLIKEVFETETRT